VSSFLSDVILDRESYLPIYVQLSNVIASRIEKGDISPGSILPGSRILASELQIHRQTVVSAYAELSAQGFVKSIPKRGTVVNENIPVLYPQKVEEDSLAKKVDKAAFDFTLNRHLEVPVVKIQNELSIDEGLPDLRLSPIAEIRRNYKAIGSKLSNLALYNYQSPQGSLFLIKELCEYLNSTRGMNVSKDQILITRGSQMGLYLASSLLIGKGDKVAVGTLNYQTANMTFVHSGGHLKKIPVDKQGLDIAELEKVCRQHMVKAVNVTSHHHHPTTATLSVDRRVALLQLAAKYNFAIIEDDYDYDFHYERSPLMPLISADTNGNVIYVGGISKIIAPGLRIGFLVGPPDFIRKATELRRIIDRQGDQIMEQVLGMMLATGDYQRHTKKVLRLYEKRRDVFLSYLDSIPEFSFDKPSGGLAAWVGLDKAIIWDKLTETLKRRHLAIPRWQSYDPDGIGHNHIRMGFASLNEIEMKKVFEILQWGIRMLKS